MTDISAALARLTRACVHVSKILDDGERDPRWAESQELEEAALAYGRAVRQHNTSADAGAEPSPNSPELASPATFIDDDIPWPSAEEWAEEWAEQVAERARRRDRYPIFETLDAIIRYTDWHSRTLDDLLKRALACGLVAIGETIRAGWIERDRETGEFEYIWLDEHVIEVTP